MDLDLSGYVQFGGVQLQQTVQPTEGQDGNDDGKVTDELSELGAQTRRGGRGRGENSGDDFVVRVTEVLKVEVWVRKREQDDGFISC